LGDGTIVLRRWQESDLDCVEEAGSDPDIPSGTTVPATYTPAEGRAWIERQWGRQENDEGLSLAVADAASCEALGNINLLFRRQPGTAAIGYWLVPRVRGQGLGSRAVALLAHWALADTPLERLEALVLPGNVASQRVLEKAGFRREGMLRSHLVIGDRRVDALMFALLPSDVV
jgi:RimJ/RimL family protein N-acetyltransferase